MGKQIGSKINNRYFPEKLTYDGFQYRTTRINEAMNLQSLINSKIQSKKNGTNPSFLDLSHEVSRLGFEPKTYGLEGRCSIQLSYRDILLSGCKYIKNYISSILFFLQITFISSGQILDCISPM